MAAKMLKSKWGEVGEGAGSPIAAVVDSAIASSLRSEPARTPLDLTLSASEPPPASLPAEPVPPCPECRELRKEVREMRDSLHHLIEQFHTFAARFPPPPAHPGPPDQAKKPRTSPPSSLSSLDAAWPAPKLEPGEVSSPSGDSRAKLSSPDSASSADSAAVNLAARKRKFSSSQRSSAFKAAPPPHPRSQSLSGVDTSHLAKAPSTPTEHHSFLKNPYFPSLLSTHLLQQHKSSFVPNMSSSPGPLSPWQIQNILLNWQNSLQKPQENLLAGLHAQSHFPNISSALPLFSAAGLNPSAPLNQTKTSSSNEVTPSPSSDDNSISPNNNNNKHMSSKNSLSQHRRPSLPSNLSAIHHDHSKGTISLHHSDVIATLQSSLETHAKKKPGPDDFIKEFVEAPGLGEKPEEAEAQIPVPEALDADPDFRAASEEEILGSSRWSELDWQEAVTRLAKKLAERRVFGPQLMAKATVAGTNHSNYPNLPMEGILYIEGVCRRTLFPQLSRREFAEFFRPAVKGLAARCRRIRHSMKPSPSTPSAHPLDLAQELLALAGHVERPDQHLLSPKLEQHLLPPKQEHIHTPSPSLAN